VGQFLVLVVTYPYLTIINHTKTGILKMYTMFLLKYFMQKNPFLGGGVKGSQFRYQGPRASWSAGGARRDSGEMEFLRKKIFFFDWLFTVTIKERKFVKLSIF